MKITVQEAADLLGGRLYGDPSTVITGISKIEDANPGDLTFFYLSSYEKFLATTKASAILVKPDVEKSRTDTCYIEVEDPKNAFQKIISSYFSYELSLTGIDNTASISPSAKVGKKVSIGKNVVISENCVIGDNTKIFHNTVLMDNVKIGSDSLIYPNVTIRENCVIGNKVIIHSGAVIGSDGFGYTQDKNGAYEKIPQIGNVIIEDDVEIGSNVSIDRASLGSTIIKKGVKLDNLIQIAHNVVIGENTVVSAQVGISGSTKIGKNCILAGQVGVVGHIVINDGIIVGAQSGVSKSLVNKGTYSGSPANEIGSHLKLQAHVRNIPTYTEKIKQLQKDIEEIKSQVLQNKSRGEA